MCGWVTPHLRHMSPECHQTRFRPKGPAGRSHIRLEPGVEALLADLAWDLRMEGKKVRLGEWDKERARWRATVLDGTGRHSRVAAWNLEAVSPPPEGGWRAGDAAILQDLTTQRGWNGRSVLLLEADRQAGKWRVLCPGGITVNVATGKLRRPPRDGPPCG